MHKSNIFILCCIFSYVTETKQYGFNCTLQSDCNSKNKSVNTICLKPC